MFHLLNLIFITTIVYFNIFLHLASNDLKSNHLHLRKSARKDTNIHLYGQSILQNAAQLFFFARNFWLALFSLPDLLT